MSSISFTVNHEIHGIGLSRKKDVNRNMIEANGI